MPPRPTKLSTKLEQDGRCFERFGFGLWPRRLKQVEAETLITASDKKRRATRRGRPVTVLYLGRIAHCVAGYPQAKLIEAAVQPEGLAKPKTIPNDIQKFSAHRGEYVAGLAVPFQPWRLDNRSTARPGQREIARGVKEKPPLRGPKLRPLLGRAWHTCQARRMWFPRPPVAFLSSVSLFLLPTVPLSLHTAKRGWMRGAMRGTSTRNADDDDDGQ